MKKIGELILLYCILLLGLCACHNPAKNSDEKIAVDLNKQEHEIHVLHNDTTEIFNRVKALNGYVVYSVIKDNDEIFYDAPMEKEFLSTPLFSIDIQTTDILDYTIGMDGSIFFLVLETLEREENIYLKKRTVEGSELTIKHLNSFHNGETDDCYQWKVLVNPDGNLLVHSNYAYLLMDESGNVLDENHWEKQEIFEIAYIDNYSLLLWWNVDYKMTFYYVDLRTREKTVCINLPEWRSAVAIKNSDENICIGTTSSLCQYDVKTQKTKQLIRWADYGIVGDTICCIYEQEGKVHVISYEQNVLYDIGIQQNKADELRTEIRLGCFGETTQLRKAVAAFNKDNQECVVVVEDYYEEDEEVAVNHLYNDVLAGKGPDIIQFPSEYIYDKKLGQAGVLEDLVPYLEGSILIQKEDIIDSLYQSLLVEEKLYMLPTNFMLDVLATKRKWVGEDGMFTFEEIIQAMDACKMKGQISRNELLRCGAIYGGYSTQPNDTNLKMYLEIASALPEQMCYEPDEFLRQSGQIPFEMTVLSNMTDYMYKKSAWGEDAVFTGYPEAEGNGMAFRLRNCFGISSKSSHKEEAWRFLESFFTEEWQESITPNWDFSICKAVLEHQLNAAMEINYYEDVHGVKQEAPILTYSTSEDTINVYPARIEDVEHLKEMIGGVKVINRGDSVLVEIVQEEALYYFDEKKSIDETIDIINNRVTVFISENGI